MCRHDQDSFTRGDFGSQSIFTNPGFMLYLGYNLTLLIHKQAPSSMDSTCSGMKKYSDRYY